MEVVIGEKNWRDFIMPVVDGEQKMHGLIPRDYDTAPFGTLTYARGFDLDLIPESEWAARLEEQKARKARLSDVRNVTYGKPIPSRDQDSKGYCWAHSGVSAHLLARARMNEPYADLSAYAVACMIKNFQDEGGWAGEGVKFQAEKGCPTSKFWPQQSMSKSNDNEHTWENARLHRYTQWMDLDKDNMKAQLVTCLLLGIPLAADFNWWSHSVALADIESLDPFRVRLWNSWGDKWSSNGMGLIEDSKAIPDAAIACVVVSPSLV